MPPSGKELGVSLESLIQSTGHERADLVLRQLVTRFEGLFHGRIRAYYVIGSFARGNPVANSDLDMVVVFRQMPGQDEEARARQEARVWRRGQNGLELDLNIQGESAMLRTGLPDIRVAALPVFGEDIRDRMGPVEMETFLRRRMHFAWEPSARARPRLPYLSPPLDFPDPFNPFFGYACNRVPTPEGKKIAATKALIGCVGKPATALLARAGIYAGSKEDCIRLFREHIGGAGADLLEAIERSCRRAWGYGIPAPEEDRDRLRTLCRQTLAFENDFLSRYRDFLLEELRAARPESPWISIAEAAGFLNAPEHAIHATIRDGGLPSRQEAGERLIRVPHLFAIMAATRLHQVRFNDEEMAHALKALTRSKDAHLRRAANLALAQIRGAHGWGVDPTL